MIKFSKKMLALIMSMLMIFSCVAVSASAEGEAETTETIQIAAPVWVFEQETMSFFVERPENIAYGEGEETVYYPVEITVEPEATLIKNTDGSYIIENIEFGKEYTITASIVDETNTVAGSASVKAVPVITVPGTKDICEFDPEDRTITVEKIDNIVIDGKECVVGVMIEPNASSQILGDGTTMFFNLNYSTNYTVKAYVAPSADIKFYSEDNFEVTVKGQQDAPATPVPSAITSKSITIVAAAGCQYALKDADGEFVFDWTDSTGKDAIMFDGLDSETTYTVVAKKKATETHYESTEVSITATTKKAGKAGTPTLVLADKTNNSITVKAEGDVEFKLGDGAWQASGEFKGLKADTQYNIYGRYTFDAATQDPSAVSEALIVKTNAVANFEANEKKITFTGENGAYANSEIEFTVTGDGPVDMNKVVYGDTRIVPVSYKVVFGSDEIKASTAWDTQKIKNTGSFTAEAYAEKVVTVKVVFEEQEYKGKNADGTANWVISKSYEKSFDVEVGRVDSPMTKITEFFEGILNFLLNTVPSFLAEALQSDVWGKLFEALGKLGSAIG
ncbi:MAG: hypothetical protein IJD49_02895 [Clostridia bacterium]|nr:hypothetical protein [Clostridia bacterium]